MPFSFEVSSGCSRRVRLPICTWRRARHSLRRPAGVATGAVHRPPGSGREEPSLTPTALRLRTRPAVSPLGRVPPCARQRCVSLWLCASVTRNRSCCGPGGLPGPLHPGPVGAHPGARAAGAGREQGRSVPDPSHMRSPTSGRARGRRQTRSDAGERRLRPPAPRRTARRSLARRGVAVPRPGSARWACVRGPGPGSASGGHAMGHPGGSAGRPAGGDSPGGVTGEARGGWGRRACRTAFRKLKTNPKTESPSRLREGPWARPHGAGRTRGRVPGSRVPGAPGASMLPLCLPV